DRHHVETIERIERYCQADHDKLQTRHVGLVEHFARIGIHEVPSSTVLDCCYVVASGPGLRFSRSVIPLRAHSCKLFDTTSNTSFDRFSSAITRRSWAF